MSMHGIQGLNHGQHCYLCCDCNYSYSNPNLILYVGGIHISLRSVSALSPLCQQLGDQQEVL